MNVIHQSGFYISLQNIGYVDVKITLYLCKLTPAGRAALAELEKDG